jgi:hypothetical protein
MRSQETTGLSDYGESVQADTVWLTPTQSHLSQKPPFLILSPDPTEFQKFEVVMKFQNCIPKSKH